MLSKAEQETIITWNNAEDTAEIYTHDKRLINRIEKLIEKGVSVDRGKDMGEARVYNVPKRTIRVQFPRVLTEEEKQEARDRFDRVRVSKKEGAI